VCSQLFETLDLDGVRGRSGPSRSTAGQKGKCLVLAQLARGAVLADGLLASGWAPVEHAAALPSAVRARGSGELHRLGSLAVLGGQAFLGGQRAQCVVRG